MIWIAAFLKALPQLLKLSSLIFSMINDAQQRGIGRDQAVKDALEKAHFDISAGDAAEIEGRSAHNANPDSDSGFDTEFRRH